MSRPTLKQLWSLARFRFLSVTIPTGWEDWHEPNPADAFRRYETRALTFGISRTKLFPQAPDGWSGWKYDGRKQRVFQRFGISILLTHWYEDRQIPPTHAHPKPV